MIILQSKHLKSNIANHEVADKLIWIFPVPTSCSMKWKSLMIFFLTNVNTWIRDWWEAILYPVFKENDAFWHLDLQLFSWK